MERRPEPLAGRLRHKPADRKLRFSDRPRASSWPTNGWRLATTTEGRSVGHEEQHINAAFVDAMATRSARTRRCHNAVYEGFSA